MARYFIEVESLSSFVFFFFNDTAPTEIYPLSLHDALPISRTADSACRAASSSTPSATRRGSRSPLPGRDRKSTRLNSSHLVISYAVFCLKKKKHAHPKPLRGTKSKLNCAPLRYIRGRPF